MRTAIALILLTATASAGNNELTITETSRALRTSSANAITEDSLIGGELAYSRKLDVSFMPKLELWTVGTFAWGVADGTMFQTLTTELDTLALTVGARARYRLHHRLDASARLDIGATRAAFSVRDDMDHSASDAGWGAITGAGVGIDCYAFRGQRYALAFRLELGAVATSSIPLTATPDSSGEGTLQLEMTAASLGSLNLSGPVFAASIVGQW
jgi:hypothetical protein